jgi:hypothetical protein
MLRQDMFHEVTYCRQTSETINQMALERKMFRLVNVLDAVDRKVCRIRRIEYVP